MAFNSLLKSMFSRARNSDPITSVEASDKVDFAGDHIQTILECLAQHGPLGKDGIATRTKLDGNQVARRLSEMSKLNFIELTGETVKSNSNRNERQWRIKEMK
jgi:transcription initiation factor IIE alpha subunit